jgi:hypothetical protein
MAGVGKGATMTPDEIARRFLAAQIAAMEAAFIAAFEDGVEEALAELEGEDDEVAWEDLLDAHGADRSRVMGFYLPTIVAIAGEIASLFQHREGLILGMLAMGLTREQALQRVAAYDEAIRTRVERIKQRLARVFEGIAWSAAELGRAAVISGAGRRIHWVLDSAAEHCETCIGLAGRSPYATIAEIGTVPGAGDTKCGDRCRCHLEFG